MDGEKWSATTSNNITLDFSKLFSTEPIKAEGEKPEQAKELLLDTGGGK